MKRRTKTAQTQWNRGVFKTRRYHTSKPHFLAKGAAEQQPKKTGIWGPPNKAILSHICTRPAPAPKLRPRSFDPEALTNARTANGPSATPACAHRVCGRRRGHGCPRLTPWGRGSAADAVGTGSDPRVPTGSAQAPIKKRSWWFQGGFPTHPRTATKFYLKSTGILNDGA